MPWKYNITDSSSVPSPNNYQYSSLNTLNQEVGNISIPADSAISQIKALVSGYSATVNARLVLWTNNGAALRQSATFSM